ncbi:hypothetical protein V6N13_028326 [Hibiscus sabdariffa]
MSSEPAMRDHTVLTHAHTSPSNADGGQDSLGSNHGSSSAGLVGMPSRSAGDGGQVHNSGICSPIESANHRSRVSDGQLRNIVEAESEGLQISDNTCSSGEHGDTEEPAHNAAQGEKILPVAHNAAQGEEILPVVSTLPGVSARANGRK